MRGWRDGYLHPYRYPLPAWRSVSALVLFISVCCFPARDAVGQRIAVEQRANIDFGADGLTLVEPCISATPERRKMAVLRGDTSAPPCRGLYDVWHLIIPQPASAPPIAPYMLATNLRTAPASEDPPLVLATAFPNESPKEYSGIDTYFDASANKTVVWCLHAGTSTIDDDSNKTVLFGSRLLIGP